MSTNQPIDQGAIFKSVGDHWVLFLVEGIVLVVLGLRAIVIPPLATPAITIQFGALLLISGIVGLVTTFMARQAPGFWWSLLSAVLGIVAGIVLLVCPISGMLPLSYLLIAFFAIEGFASMMFAIEHRRQFSGRWGWMLLSGTVDVILALILFTGLLLSGIVDAIRALFNLTGVLPGTAFWALGLVLGVNLVLGGAAMIAMAQYARSAARNPGAL